MKLQAREIIRAAKRHNIKMHSSNGNENHMNATHCAVAVIAQEVIKGPYFLPDKIASVMDISPGVLWAIDAGFENRDNTGLYACQSIGPVLYERYRKVGKRVREATLGAC